MPFGSLWIPVVVSAVVVFVASSLVHMVLRYHKSDYRGLSNEEDVRNVVRKGSPAAGLYVIPYCSDPSQMKDPAVAKKYAEGPVGMLTILPSGMPNMGKYLGLWFLFCFLASFVAAYVARHTLSPGSDLMTVTRITGTVAFASYGLGNIADSIWKGQPWANTGRHLIDAVIYSVLTGLTFRLLWPA
jgi:hypothetical protein